MLPSGEAYDGMPGRSCLLPAESGLAANFVYNKWYGPDAEVRNFGRVLVFATSGDTS